MIKKLDFSIPRLIFQLTTVKLGHKYELFDVTFDLHKKEENLITTEYEDKFVSKNMPIYSLKAIKEDV